MPPAASSTWSQLSSTSSNRALRSEAVERVERGSVADRSDRERPRDRREHPFGRTLGAEIDEEDTVIEAIDAVGGEVQREPRSCRCPRRR